MVPSGTGTFTKQYRETAPQFIGRSTYIVEPTLISPGASSGFQDLSNITFEWNGVVGATDYVIEVSSTMDFQRDKTWVKNIPLITTSSSSITRTYTNELSLSTELSDVQSGDILYWRVGAKNRQDTNPPYPATPNATLSGAKNTRYVYTPQMGMFSFQSL